MNEDFVPKDLATKLKEKGFKQDCIAYYMPHSDELIYNVKPYKGVELYSFNSLRKELISSDFIDAPTISQVLKWLRKEKKLLITVSTFVHHGKGIYYYGAEIYDISKMPTLSQYRAHCFNCDSYEEAELAGIEYVLENLI